MDQRVEPHPGRMSSSFASHGIEPHPLRFTGSGGEYFRVWIVNVLLGIVTLGLYTPWARRRTAQYFYGHTLVAGSPLEFTGQQRRMVFGFLVLVGLTAAYQIAARSGQDTAVGLFIIAGALLSPLIWGSAMRFRLGNTRWRGLRLQFTANWRQVYAASWPVFAIAAVWLVAVFGLRAIAPEAQIAPSGRKLPQVTGAMWGLIAVALALTVLCFIRLEYNYRSMLVLHSRLGSEPGRWKPVYMDFVKVWLATVAVFILSVLLIGAVLGVAFGGSWMLIAGKVQRLGMWLFVFIVAGIFLFGFLMLLASAPARAYREARMFQLTWDQIGVSRMARFKCNLRAGRFVGLRIKNLFLTLLTLGFYRPFARVSEYRMKLESVTLHVKGGVDQVTGQLVRQQQSGVGDALADAAGLDLIG
ncbi:YjgN family protein [Acidovorax sp. NCPPB 4044]|uniref:YjgN family protein n=1 Tax=Acidovorax sp. NCPPB 4044 TaxID=2940490 RepID=UPI002302C1FD|nr:YjgN family protein [Acidovorax sp. NCPPB 4044]MDA8519266.1 YjgN family protein [Acidovorax sp. NCPPB 4044]